MKVIQEVTATGLYLPKTLTEKWGWRPGTKVVIETQNRSIHIYPEELAVTDIADIACIYLLEKVGDAVAIKTPFRSNGNWTVPVILAYAKKDLGKLVFSPSGELIIEESDSPSALLAKAG